ncbi:type I restriction-modification system [Candidatus Nitrosoglobus terrae]|uniref:Type I restriction-modification system n=1 Tax=Candidatus Nitrosoglobus terrae TaxID=1630141 RepID=A0A1Q2SNR9_9GAMM|nr:type I restriction endonuclease [Candidatus Nitrosoglobus terrae]BAW80788.1 type I restriction-modification system [Candidatus Nitrosoglobus terrae]
MAFLSESEVGQALLEQLRSLGYATTSDELINPDSQQPERERYERYDEMILKKRFTEAVARLNPSLPLEAQQDAIRRVIQ